MKTVVKNLKTAGLGRSSIVKVTGHRNEKLLDDYDEGDEREQRQLSHTISLSKNINNQLTRGNRFTSDNSSTSSSSNIFNPLSPVPQYGNNFNQAPFAFQMPCYISGQNDQRQCFMNINHFHQCQVTFNVGNTASPEKPQSAAPPGEDSISNWFIFRKSSSFENVDRFRLNKKKQQTLTSWLLYINKFWRLFSRHFSLRSITCKRFRMINASRTWCLSNARIFLVCKFPQVLACQSRLSFFNQ